ncbi:hypothetical protein M0R45_025304 [Rubus argutus]|uniref:DUF3444 domain-containing protein n=1 Tax=Rubus argutus TaxID=59490 RepID=A0AAW1WVA8_RUBAR
MECNKDEAARVKEMVEEKLAAKDHMGAKKLALKAQNLFPGLWGIPQMLAVLDVYISAENKINGEADWYGILEAWSLLSDKAKRVAYDQKIRNVRVPLNVWTTVAPGFPNFTQSTNFSVAKASKATTGKSSAAFANNQSYYQPSLRTAGGFTAGHAPSVVQVAQTATRMHHAFNQVGDASRTGYVNNAAKRRCMDDVGVSRYGKDTKNQMDWVAGGAGGANFRSDRVNETSDTIFTGNDISLDVWKEMNEQGSYSVAETASKEVENGNARGKSSGNIDVQCDRNMSGNGKQVDTKNIGTCDRKQSGTTSVSSDSDAETSEEIISISVLDPDFHNFDKDRTEDSFGENQVWAAYDEDNAMPRHYAIIHSVTSLNPFTLRISWLISKTNRELGPLSWVSSGFSKTCGEFRGDVWALYRNWSPDWNELTANEVIHKYDMVEVVEDYSEQLGVAVTPLVKVSGLKTVYHRHLDPITVMLRIPKNEIF